MKIWSKFRFRHRKVFNCVKIIHFSGTYFQGTGNETIGQGHINSDNLSQAEMATSSKQPKLTNELLIDLTLFDCLPDEVQLKIFKFLEIEDLMHCAQVSKVIFFGQCSEQ